MSGEPDPLLVVNQLRDLAADPLNRRAIIQDQGCLPGLILFLGHANPQVVYSALLVSRPALTDTPVAPPPAAATVSPIGRCPQAIRYLAECRANREKLRGALGLLLSLQSVAHKSTTPGETALLASEVYELLRASGGGSEPAGGGGSRRKAQFFMGASNKRAKTVVLHIHGLDDYVSRTPRRPRPPQTGGSLRLSSPQGRRSQCEEALLKVRGVISFTFQMSLKRCVVRIRSDLKAEALASAIASTQVMAAQQVLRAEGGEEVRTLEYSGG
ncbi:Armadillo repeat-containing protein 1 [Liparis tanakae]|uniref:Armadillo repeat-containing protein 1 n=1 Tax=Liparis tanakae TaxID=230148 RepID=A0A4Z2EXC1_9TELE|nr:Armadillo repeat-containing protein 1 [Liparis tanakae]